MLEIKEKIEAFEAKLFGNGQHKEELVDTLREIHAEIASLDARVEALERSAAPARVADVNTTLNAAMATGAAPALLTPPSMGGISQ